MDPANPTSEHLHPSIVPHCLCVMHLPFHCVWGCGRYGWAWEVSRHSLSPLLLPLCSRGYTHSASVSPFQKHSHGGAPKGSFTLFLPWLWGRGSEGWGVAGAQCANSLPRHCLALCLLWYPLISSCPGTRLHRGTAVVWDLPGAIQYLSHWQEQAGNSETGMGTHSPHGVSQPWERENWPCPMAGCGGSCQKIALSFWDR